MKHYKNEDFIKLMDDMASKCWRGQPQSVSKIFKVDYITISFDENPLSWTFKLLNPFIEIGIDNSEFLIQVISGNRLQALRFIVPQNGVRPDAHKRGVYQISTKAMSITVSFRLEDYESKFK